jgi:hypothetical protein
MGDHSQILLIAETVPFFGVFPISTDERISFVIFIFLTVSTNTRNSGRIFNTFDVGWSLNVVYKLQFRLKS